jgi:hypothetical protein
MTSQVTALLNENVPISFGNWPQASKNRFVMVVATNPDIGDVKHMRTISKGGSAYHLKHYDSLLTALKVLRAIGRAITNINSSVAAGEHTAQFMFYVWDRNTQQCITSRQALDHKGYRDLAKLMKKDNAKVDFDELSLFYRKEFLDTQRVLTKFPFKGNLGDTLPDGMPIKVMLKQHNIEWRPTYIVEMLQEETLTNEDRRFEKRANSLGVSAEYLQTYLEKAFGKDGLDTSASYSFMNKLEDMRVFVQSIRHETVILMTAKERSLLEANHQNDKTLKWIMAGQRCEATWLKSIDYFAHAGASFILNQNPPVSVIDYAGVKAAIQSTALSMVPLYASYDGYIQRYTANYATPDGDHRTRAADGFNNLIEELVDHKAGATLVSPASAPHVI